MHLARKAEDGVVVDAAGEVGLVSLDGRYVVSATRPPLTPWPLTVTARVIPVSWLPGLVHFVLTAEANLPGSAVNASAQCWEQKWKV